MNAYESDISQLIKLWQGKGRFDFDSMARYLVEDIKNPASRQMLISVVMSKLGISYDEAKRIIDELPSQLLWELLNIQQGVEIVVEDKGLVEAMLRTDIEAVMSDIRTPFPICEFVFPEGIPISGLPFEVSGCLLVSIGDGSLFRKAYSKYGVFNKEELTNGFAFFTRLVRTGKERDKDGVSWLRFMPDEPLENLPATISILTESDRQATRKMAYLAMGICLYFQTKEGQKALVGNSTAKKRNNVSPAEGRALKKRRSYRVVDLITKTFGSQYADKGGSRASPKAHWRKLHMRTLRSPKYRRNENGSVRAIWIMPMQVNTDKGAPSHSSRIVKTSSPHDDHFNCPPLPPQPS